MERENQDPQKYYEKFTKINEGFGIVYSAQKVGSNEMRAIKIIKKKSIVDPLRNAMLKEPTLEQIKPYINCFYNEVKNMKICEGENNINENTVKFYEYFDTQEEFAIVMEKCDENIFQVLTHKREGFKPDEIQEILKQLNNTFRLMVDNKIIYRDLKTENILFKYKNKEKTKYTVKLKLGDGSNLISQLRKQDASTKNKFYCNNYNAPEILEGKLYNEKCDLWSLGCIIYVLLFRKYAYTGATEDAILNNIKKNGQSHFLSSHNPQLDDLIKKLIIEDPNKRLSWKEYFNHPFIKEDFREVYEIGKKIGEEGSGIIYRAKIKKTGQYRAVKIFDLNIIRDNFMKEYFRTPTKEELKPYIEKFYNEMRKMEIIEGINKDNQNAVKVYEYYENDNEFAIVMELCDCNLLTYFIDKNKSFNSEEIKEILIQLNNSLKIMSDNNIVNRALKLENIFLKFEDKEKNKYIIKLKLTEESIFLKDINNKKEINIINDSKIVPPEILKKEDYNEKIDLWCLGVIIYVLFFRDFPYKSNNKKEKLEKIKSGNISIKTDNSDLDDLLTKLLKIDPKERIGWNDYFMHPFFKEKIPDIIIREEDYNKYYIKGERLGEGAFGSVFCAIKKDTKEKRAIKIIDKDRIRGEYMKEYFRSISDEEMKMHINDLLNEIKSMKLMEGRNNKNSVKFYECFETTDEFSIIMELCDDNLTKYIANRGPLNPKEIRQILKQLNNSFKIMSQNRLVHRDLKLENILVKKEKEKLILKITDYGLSKQLATISKKLSTKAGTPIFSAPEILKGEKYNEECDLWSLGIVIYVLFFKDYPYKGESELALLNHIQTKGQSILNKTGDHYLDDLIRKLLVEDPKKRIKWEQYFNHPFITGIIPKPTDNKIIIKLKIKQNLISKEIYFFDKENFNEINETNIEIYINNSKIDFCKFFKPSKEGEYEIKIIFKNKINNCKYMFNKCKDIIYIDLSSFDSSNVTNMSYMFSECSNLKDIILSNLNTTNVIDMSYMFNKCYELKNIDFPESFNTQNLENMASMFHWCQNLTEITFPTSFKTNKVTSMKTLFGKCYILKKINIKNFNTSEVKDMSYMFDQCTKLEELLINPSTFKTDKVSNMSYMFNECHELKKIDLSSFNIKNVKYTSYMFGNCQKLDEVDLSGSKFNKDTIMIHMFEGCSNINRINISSLDALESKKLENMFDYLSKSTKIIVNKNCINEFKRMFKAVGNQFLSN